MKPFKLTPIAEIISRPYKNNWLIKNYFEIEKIGVLIGGTGTAKTFLINDMTFCIGAGIDWNGNRTKQGKVVYVAGEGFTGLQKRFEALEQKYKTKANDLYLSKLPADLSNEESIDAMCNEILEECPRPLLIVFDTLHRNFGNGDENSAKDVGKLLDAICRLRDSTGATILLVHHSGHGNTERARGSSSLKGGMDFEYLVKKKDNLITLSCTKAKDTNEPEPVSFNLVPTTLLDKFDDEGEPINTAVLESTTHIKSTIAAYLSTKDHDALKALAEAIIKKGKPIPAKLVKTKPELTGKRYIHLEDWRSEAYKSIDPDGNKASGTKQQAFNRSRKKLIEEGKVIEIDNHLLVAA